MLAYSLKKTGLSIWNTVSAPKKVPKNAFVTMMKQTPVKLIVFVKLGS